MKKFILIFLCCVTVFAVNLFYGCTDDKELTNHLPENENIQNDDNENDITQGADDNLSSQTPDEGFEDTNSGFSLSGYKVQSKTTVNIRSDASSNSQVLGQLLVYDTVPVIEKANEFWYKVLYNNDVAYVSANESYTKLINWENAQSTPVTGLEVQSLANVNIRADVSGEIIGQLTRWQTAPLISKVSDQWYKILYNGQDAYITADADLTRVYDPEKVSAMTEDIINTGMSVLGTPYEFGATRVLYYSGNPNPYFTGKTFDCSSFVQYAFYKGANIKLQGDSRSQSKYGLLVQKAELKRGDLIFMWSSARRYNTGIEQIGHVVIYLGDNKILHTWGTGGVRVQEFSAGWQERFILARRMF